MFQKIMVVEVGYFPGRNYFHKSINVISKKEMKIYLVER